MRRWWLLLPWLLAWLGLAGCAALQGDALRESPPAGLAPRVELAATPFFAQTAYHCGPAALATVLTASGAPAAPELLGEQVFLPARTGTLQLEMIAGARRHGRVATRLPPTLIALLRELEAGQPVVVLQNLGLSWYPAWHYAVAIGYDLPRGEMLLRSGSTERLVLSMRTFEHTWVRAGSWAVAVHGSDRWPATAERAAVIEAAVGFERAAAAADAARAYRSALQRFPAELSLQIGLGNSLHASGAKAEAAEAFAAATRDHPDNAPAWINLASTLAELGRRDEARLAADRAVAAASPEWAERARALQQSLR